MEFRKTDHATERQLKLDVIAVYNHRLDEREKRKKFVIDHNLLDYKKQQIGGKKRPKVREFVWVLGGGASLRWHMILRVLCVTIR